MIHTREEQMEAFGRFLDILDELRVKCPWDRKQTNESLRPNTIEETYELCDALMSEGSAAGTPLNTLLFPSFSFSFSCSQFSDTCPAVSAFTSPNT